MPLKDFCRAIYLANGKVKRQSTFIAAAFKAAGSRYLCTDSYWSQLFDRDTPLGVDHANTFPNPINKEDLRKFLCGHLTPPVNTNRTLEDRCVEVATTLSLPLARDIQAEPFVWALTDWFNAIVHATETDDTLKQAYLKRVERIDPDEEQTNGSLYPGDMAEEMRSTNDGKREIPFWKRFTYEWAIKNTGAVTWTDRMLVCVNPKDTHIRPLQSRIEIPQTPAGNKPVFLKVDFTARGQEGVGTSCWEMQDAEGNNCFPQPSERFNVTINVINPNIDKRTGAEQ